MVWFQSIEANVTRIRAQEIQELRKAVDAFRTAFGLGPAFAAANTPAGSISAANILSLLTALNDGRAGRYPAVTFTAPAEPYKPVRGEHIRLLRDALR